MTNLSSPLTLTLLLILLLPALSQALATPDIVVNEITWMGTKTSYNDEWLELYNNTGSEINLSGWKLVAKDGTPEINLSGKIRAGGFYLLERTNDETAPGIAADQIYSGPMGNNGENFLLYDSSGNLIDSVDCASGWFAGDNSTKQTMERKDSSLPGNVASNWSTSQSPGGTPRDRNSPMSAIKTEPKVAEIAKPTSENQTPAPNSANILSPEIKEKKAVLAEEESGLDGLSAENQLPLFLSALTLAIVSGTSLLFFKKRWLNNP